jgi:hypothetical protein
LWTGSSVLPSHVPRSTAPIRVLFVPVGLNGHASLPKGHGPSFDPSSDPCHSRTPLAKRTHEAEGSNVSVLGPIPLYS